jgi:hypothetical protein
VPDTHVESYLDAGRWRACAIHTGTGRVLYITWPYGNEQRAIERARRWLREEYRRCEEPAGLWPEA